MRQDSRPQRWLIAGSLAAILSTAAGWTQVHAQTMQEFAGRERSAAALVARSRDAVAGLGKSVERPNSEFAFTTPDSVYVELAYMDGENPVFRKTANLRQSDIIHATVPRANLGLSGEGVEIGLWDKGQAFAHPEFAARLTRPQQDGATAASGHATHVAGTLAAAGLVEEATGLAPEATLTSYDWRFDYLEMYREAQEGLRVSNHSYSYAAGWEQVYQNGSFVWSYRTQSPRLGEYSVTTWFWDDVMWQNPSYLAVKAAGNEAGQGPDAPGTPHYHDGIAGQLQFDSHPNDCESGFSCLGSLSTSKNALVVGSVAEDGNSIADFSSRGPTLDGRIKPDVVSAGSGVYSTYGTSGYSVSSGTSMAAPTVAGSVALMVEMEHRLFGWAHPLRSSTMKALLIHGADDLGNPGPDYTFGWGRVDVERTLNLMIDSQRESVAIREVGITDVTVLDFVAAGGAFKATLSWIDPIGRNPNGVIDKSAPVLIEDVDIEVEQDGAVNLPYVLDPLSPAAPATHGVNTLDNVEQVELANVKPGPVRIVIRRKNGGAEPLVVSLVVSGLSESGEVTTAVQPTDVTTPFGDISVYPNPVRAGDRVRIESGSISPQEVTVSLFDVTGREVSVARLGYIDRIQASVTIPPTTSAGSYFVRIEGDEVNEVQRLLVTR